MDIQYIGKVNMWCTYNIIDHANGHLDDGTCFW